MLHWGHSCLPPTIKHVPSVACYIVINNTIERHCGKQNTSRSSSRGCSFPPLSSTSDNSSFPPPLASPALLGTPGQAQPCSSLPRASQGSPRTGASLLLCGLPVSKGSRSPSPGSLRACRTEWRIPGHQREIQMFPSHLWSNLGFTHYHLTAGTVSFLEQLLLNTPKLVISWVW